MRIMISVCPDCLSSHIKVDKLKHIIKCKHCGAKFRYTEVHCANVNIPLWAVTRIIKP